jgi:hypothetical protein
MDTLRSASPARVLEVHVHIGELPPAEQCPRMQDLFDTGAPIKSLSQAMCQLIPEYPHFASVIRAAHKQAGALEAANILDGLTNEMKAALMLVFAQDEPSYRKSVCFLMNQSLRAKTRGQVFDRWKDLVWLTARSMAELPMLMPGDILSTDRWTRLSMASPAAFAAAAAAAGEPVSGDERAGGASGDGGAGGGQPAAPPVAAPSVVYFAASAESLSGADLRRLVPGARLALRTFSSVSGDGDRIVALVHAQQAMAATLGGSGGRGASSWSGGGGSSGGGVGGSGSSPEQQRSCYGSAAGSRRSSSASDTRAGPLLFRLTLTQGSARDLSPFSAFSSFDSEQEIVLPPHTCFTVLSVCVGGGDGGGGSSEAVPAAAAAPRSSMTDFARASFAPAVLRGEAGDAIGDATPRRDTDAAAHGGGASGGGAGGGAEAYVPFGGAASGITIVHCEEQPSTDPLACFSRQAADAEADRLQEAQAAAATAVLAQAAAVEAQARRALAAGEEVERQADAAAAAATADLAAKFDALERGILELRGKAAAAVAQARAEQRGAQGPPLPGGGGGGGGGG